MVSKNEKLQKSVKEQSQKLELQIKKQSDDMEELGDKLKDLTGQLQLLKKREKCDLSNLLEKDTFDSKVQEIDLRFQGLTQKFDKSS